MKRSALAILAALIALLVLALPALSAVGPCPDGGTKTESGNMDGVVLPAGTSFCVKAGEENSGIITADGSTTLLGYVTWLNQGGQTPGVSHYVVYASGTTTTSSTTTTSTTTSSTTTTTEPPGTTTTAQETTTTLPGSTTTDPADPTTTTTVPAVSLTSVPEVIPYTGFDPALLAGVTGLLTTTGAYLLRRSRR